MSHYEMFLLGGSAMIALAVLLFFSAASRDNPVRKALVVFILGGVLLYFADLYSPNGIEPGDIPSVLYKFVLMFF